MLIDKLYTDLLAALSLVAAPAEIQFDAMRGYSKVAEEIAMIYTDASISVPQLVVHDRVSEDTKLLFDELDKQFDVIAGNEKLLQNAQLETSVEWSTTREIAVKILTEMNQE